MSSSTQRGRPGAVDLLFRPLGRWRAQAVFRFFGLVIFQLCMMGASATVSLADYLAIPWHFFALMGSGLLLLLLGPRLVTLLAVAGASLSYLLLVVLADPIHQLAEEYLVLIALPSTAALLVVIVARSRLEDFDVAVDEALIALARWTAVVVAFFAAFHKFNADFFDPAVSCGAGLLHWIASVFPGITAIPGVVAFLAGPAAVLGEVTIPLLLLVSPRAGILFTLVVMGTIGHGNTTGFTSLVICLSTSFLRHADGPVIAAGLRRHWPILVVTMLLLSTVSVRIYSGIRWFEYFLFEWILLGAGLSVLELVLADARALLDADPASRWPRLREMLMPRVDLAGLLPGPRAVTAVLVLFAVLGTANGLSPYVGLKERMSFAMFSNLRVDRDRWNHYVMPRFLDLRDDDGFLRVVDVRPSGVWKYHSKEVGPGMYSVVGLERRLISLAQEGGEVDLAIQYRGYTERYPRATRNGDLRVFLEGLPHSRMFRESLTLGTPQTCVH